MTDEEYVKILCPNAISIKRSMNVHNVMWYLILSDENISICAIMGSGILENIAWSAARKYCE